MAKDSEDEQQLLDDIEDDLLALIQEEGLTASRLQTFGANIMGLYGSTNAGYVREAIRRQVLEMEADQYTKSLRSALSIFNDGGGHKLLTDRRAALMDEEGFDKSEDTLRRWERRAIKTLTRKLVEHAASLKNTGGAAFDYEWYTRKSEDLSEQIDGLRVRLEDEIKVRRRMESHLADFARDMSFALYALRTNDLEGTGKMDFPLELAADTARWIAANLTPYESLLITRNETIVKYYESIGKPPEGLYTVPPEEPSLAPDNPESSDV